MFPLCPVLSLRDDDAVTFDRRPGTLLSVLALRLLQGEDVTTVSVGASHAAAVSAGGDVFMWGVGSFGRLGFGFERSVPTPTLLNVGIPSGTEAVRES
jgi:alpha-tubulin suppressor-like RCC1 family protein